METHPLGFTKVKIYSLGPLSGIKKSSCAACDLKALAFVREEHTSQHHCRFLKVLIDDNLPFTLPSFVVVRFPAAVQLTDRADLQPAAGIQ